MVPIIRVGTHFQSGRDKAAEREYRRRRLGKHERTKFWWAQASLGILYGNSREGEDIGCTDDEILASKDLNSSMGRILKLIFIWQKCYR